MEYAKFTEIFTPNQKLSRAHRTTTEVKALYGESASQSAVFQEIFSRYVSGEPFSLGEIDKRIREHLSWQKQHGSRLSSALDSAVSDLENGAQEEAGVEFRSILRALAFHAINAPCLTTWRRLADNPPDDSPELQKKQATANQINLAYTAIPMVGGLIKVTESGNFFAKRDHDGSTYSISPLAGCLVGLLNEIDTAVVLHELAKRNSAVIFLPAPGAYEHSCESGNIDQFVVDLLRRRIAPIQVKSSVTQETAARYHPDITLIDGRIDLGNELGICPPGISSRVSQAWSGLISVHHMATIKAARVNHHPGKGFVPTENDRRLLIAKQMAVRYSKVAKPNNLAATDIVTSRVIEKLHQEAA